MSECHFLLTTAKFGCQLPQNTSDINHIFEVVKECESLGYDSVWAYDHLAPYWLQPRSSLEPWTLLSAIAARTSKIKIGSLVSNVNLRNPALLAKITSTVDSISRGRLIVGLGVGDRMSIEELRSYGYRFPSLQERIDLLRETIMVLKAMWTGNKVSLKGKAANVSNAVCLPKPKQENGPPIWVGGRHRRVLDVAAELADGWTHWGLTGRKLAEQERYLLAKCAQLQRDPYSIAKSWAGTVSTAPSSTLDLAESMKAELMSQIGGETDYYIASFPVGVGRKAYEGFAEAVRSIV
jgi:alkanesulfonate monooxygenase SsuD/methylene tetrahydromethanopterin reductase-like flavin-dependent oxidoreductase (luciferase family)